MTSRENHTQKLPIHIFATIRKVRHPQTRVNTGVLEKLSIYLSF
jgi:hypothetical protein